MKPKLLTPMPSKVMDPSTPPTDVDPYTILSLPTTASADDIKRAYRKLALKYHPGIFLPIRILLRISPTDSFPADKAAPSDRTTAHTNFQNLAFAYAILSDPTRRRRYDATGSTSESLLDDDSDFNWTDFFRAQWADVVTEDSLNSFQNKYQGSAEEMRDVLDAYTKGKGSLDKVFQNVMLSNPLEDEERFRGYIDEAIQKGEVEGCDAYVNESEKTREKRMANAKKEAKMAEKEAETLKRKAAAKGKKDTKLANDTDLAAMIQQRAKGRAETFLEDLEAKYAGKKGGKSKANGKKRIIDEEPDEEAFQKTAARMKKRKVKEVEVDEDEEVSLGKEDDDDMDRDEDQEVEEEAPKPKKPRKPRLSAPTKASNRARRAKSGA